MFRKITGLILTLALLGSSVPAGADIDGQADAQQLEKIREAVARLGEGPDARVEVKLRDQTRLKGYIRESGDDYFVVREKATGKTVRIEYAQVVEAKAPRRLSVSPFIVRIALVAVPIIVTAAIVSSRSSRTSRPLTISAR